MSLLTGQIGVLVDPRAVLSAIAMEGLLLGNWVLRSDEPLLQIIRQRTALVPNHSPIRTTAQWSRSIHRRFANLGHGGDLHISNFYLLASVTNLFLVDEVALISPRVLDHGALAFVALPTGSPDTYVLLA